MTPGVMDYFFQFSPWLLIIIFWFLIMRRMQGGGQGGIFSFAKSKAKIISADKPKVLFSDVAGCEEAKVELQEIVGFLKNPKKYLNIGAKIPRALLWVLQEQVKLYLLKQSQEKLKFHFLLLVEQNLLKCLLVLVQVEFEIYLIRQRKMHQV